MSFLQIPIGTYPNTFLGYQSSVSMTTGGQNTAFGFQTLNANTTGDQNAAFGHLALSQNTTGRTSVAMGFNALFNQTTGFENVAIGHASAGGLTTGQGNIAIGAGASVGNLGSSGNITIGRSAGYVTTVNECVLIGSDSGNVNQGSNNTFIGANSGGQITTGAKNTIVGSFRGNQFGLDIRTLSNHIVLSDGDGNPRLWINNTGAVNIPGGLALTGSLSITGGTVTANNPVLSATQTWNNAAVTFTGWQLNVTDTASAAGSLLMDLQVGGASRFRVQKSGAISGSSTGMGGAGAGAWFGANGENFHLDRGTNRSPSYSFFTASGAYQVRFNADAAFGWTNGNSDASLDLSLFRDAANALAQRNGVNAQTLRVYNTFTDASNYERGIFSWASNILTVGSDNAGTGLARDFVLQAGNRLYLKAGGVTSWEVNASNGHILAVADNLYDIGSIASNRPRSIYLSANVQAGSGGQIYWANRASLTSPVNGILRLSNNAGGGGSVELQEMTAPAAPAANFVRIYAEDNGSGKTRLMALFATGAAQQIAIEP